MNTEFWIDVIIWIVPAFICYFGYACFIKYNCLCDLDCNFLLIKGFFHSIFWSCVFGWVGLYFVVCFFIIYFIGNMYNKLYNKLYDKMIKNKEERIKRKHLEETTILVVNMVKIKGLLPALLPGGSGQNIQI